MKAKCHTLYDAVETVKQSAALLGDKKRSVRSMQPVNSLSPSRKSILGKLEKLEMANQHSKPDAAQKSTPPVWLVEWAD